MLVSTVVVIMAGVCWSGGYHGGGYRVVVCGFYGRGCRAGICGRVVSMMGL